MGWSSGTFTLTTAGLPYVTGTTISSTVANNLNIELQTGINQALNKDGSNSPTANLTAGGFRITNVGAATAVADAPRASQVQNNALCVLSAVAGTNTVTGAAAITPAAYVTGQKFIFNPAETVTGAATLNVSSLGPVPVWLNGIPTAGMEMVKNVPVEVMLDTSASAAHIVGSTGFAPMALIKTTSNGRLTATAGTAITTSDVVSCSQMVFTPHRGNNIGLYSTADATWKVITFSEVSTAIPSTASQTHDWFGFLKPTGTLGIEALSWTNDTTRATAIALQNGVYIKNGDPSRRYLGTTRTVGAGIVEDSFARRNLWNYYNRVERPMQNVAETANSWVWDTASYHQANANVANQIEYVQGVSEDCVTATVQGMSSQSGTTMHGVGIGIDSTTVNSAQVMGSHNSNVIRPCSAAYRGFPGVGRHAIVWLEIGGGATTTFYGDNSGTVAQAGISGTVFG